MKYRKIVPALTLLLIPLGLTLIPPKLAYADSPIFYWKLNEAGGSYYQGAIDEVAVHEGILSTREIRTHYYLAPVYNESCTDPVRIMPLGDSITQGHSSGVDDVTKQVSYRKYLWDSLVASGYNVDFVGSQTNGEFYASEGFDPNHEGHPSWSDLRVAQNIYDEGEKWLSNHPADVILLHIGTNAVNPDEGDVERILNEIDDYEAVNNEVIVILARIINRITYSPTTTEFNDNVEAMAQARIDAGDKIIIVDMEDGAGLSYAAQPGGDMWNDLHPYSTGYKKMANVWLGALATFLPDCSPTPTPTPTPTPNRVFLPLIIN
ncbi:MAG: hypothetical protein KDJ65_37480 [Anaerolineae bacterium]|nr:hypothetical protein [Anaerolineae bacterium]